MPKKFMYVCFGISALVVAFHLGARYGNASIVDHSMTGIVACEKQSETMYHVLLDTGEGYSVSYPSGYGDAPMPYPVQPADIKCWYQQAFVTTLNEFWIQFNNAWYNYGPPPGYVSTQSTTWGEIKAEFGE
jgi:hypothetical protein